MSSETSIKLREALNHRFPHRTIFGEKIDFLTILFIDYPRRVQKIDGSVVYNNMDRYTGQMAEGVSRVLLFVFVRWF